MGMGRAENGKGRELKVAMDQVTNRCGKRKKGDKSGGIKRKISENKLEN